MKNVLKLTIIRQKYRIDGGAEKFISLMLNILSKSKIELSIITRNWPKQINNERYTIHICNPLMWNRLSRESRFARSVTKYCKKKFKKKFHIIQSHERIPYCDIFRAGDGVHKAWITQWKRILPRYKYLFYKNNSYHKYILNAEKKVFNSLKLKKIICNSKMVKEDILNFYNIKEKKIKIIYNAIDSKTFIPANNEQYYVAKQTLQIPVQSCTLIYVGSGFQRKGLLQTIYAFSLTDRYLIIVGYDHHIERYKSLTKTLGCFYRTRFVGITKNLLPYYHASDALILPTLYDPFPNAILEAMSCELPIITSWQSGGSELINIGKEGFVCDALDINNLQKFILEIPLKYKSPNMGIAARKKIINLNPNYLKNKLMNLYKTILLHH